MQDKAEEVRVEVPEGASSGENLVVKGSGGGEFEVTVPTQISGLYGYSAFFYDSFNCALVLHALNQIAMSTTYGYWMNKFVHDFTTAFAGSVVLNLLKGGNVMDAWVFDPANNFPLASFFCAWYFVNYDIPFCPAQLG